MNTILQMGLCLSSVLTTPFVFAEGVQAFNPTGWIIALLAYSPSTPVPITAPSSHKIPHSNCVPWKPVVEEEENIEAGGKRKNSIVGNLYSSQAYALQTTNCNPQSMKKEAQRSKAVED